jgi:hypothetical protein
MMDELAQLYDYDHNGPFIVKLGAGDYTPKYTPMIPAVGAPYVRDQLTMEPRDSAFILRPGVEVRGGYEGTTTDNPDEPTRKARFNADGRIKSTYSTYEAILSGDLDGDDASNIKTDNAYHVVLGVNIPPNSGTILDGLTISGGYANDTTFITVGYGSEQYGIDQNEGGGIYTRNASFTLNNVTISDNHAAYQGGGMLNWQSSSPVLTNVTISRNTVSNSNGMGGGMLNYDASPKLTNVTISENTVSGSGGMGGGIYNKYSYSALTNVTISGNSVSSGDGGGIYNFSGVSTLTNVAIFGNVANSGGGIYNTDSSIGPYLTNVTIAGNFAILNSSSGGIYNHNGSNPLIRNSIIWGNLAGTITDGIVDNSSTSTVENSDVQGWSGGTGNLSVSPDFAGLVSATSNPTTSGNYRLNSGSPAINVGSDSYYVSGEYPDLSHIDTDLDGNPRIINNIDMGAYEQ